MKKIQRSVTMRIWIFAAMMTIAMLGVGQTIDVNPNIHWKYVRTQEVVLQSGRVYQYEFPAEKGYDYVVNVTHGIDSAAVSMSITDIQYGPVKAHADSLSEKSSDLTFRVTSDGTFVLTVIVSNGTLDAKLESVVSIVRRPIVAP